MNPPVKVIASGTASTTERAENGHAEGNGTARHGQRTRHANGTSNGNGHANGASNGNGTSNGRANGSERSESDTDEHLVGFAHFPDATASPKIRWR